MTETWICRATPRHDGVECGNENQSGARAVVWRGKKMEACVVCGYTRSHTEYKETLARAKVEVREHPPWIEHSRTGRTKCRA